MTTVAQENATTGAYVPEGLLGCGQTVSGDTQASESLFGGEAPDHHYIFSVPVRPLPCGAVVLQRTWVGMHAPLRPLCCCCTCLFVTARVPRLACRSTNCTDVMGALTSRRLLVCL